MNAREGGPTDGGFSLVELLVALLVVIAIAGALAAMAAPLRSAFDRTLALGEITVRSRAGVERLIGELREAGSAASGLTQNAIVDLRPSIVPMADLDDPRIVSPIRALRLLTVPSDGGQGVLNRAAAAGDNVLELDTPSRCAQSRGVCGFVGNVQAVVFDAARAEEVRVQTVDLARMALVLDRPLARAFAVGATVIAIETVSYGVRQDADGSMRLVRISGGGAEQPIADHVVQFEVALTGVGYPPQPGTRPEAAPTYGPVPPPATRDDERDVWDAGENCTITIDGNGRQVSRLPILGSPPSLTELLPAILTDGPWCPDAVVPAFDADLLRVRRVDIVLRMEAAAAQYRGVAAAVFRRPGTARRSAEWVPDVETRISVALRNR